MKLWVVSGEVTISISTIVEAGTKKEAMSKAENHAMQGLCHQCSNGAKLGDETWCTSGELDGEPVILRAEVCE